TQAAQSKTPAANNRPRRLALADALATWPGDSPAAAHGLHGGLWRDRIGSRREPDARRQSARLYAGADHGHRHGDRHRALRPRHGLWHRATAARGARRGAAHMGAATRRQSVNEPLLEASGISVCRNGRLVLKPCNFTVHAGESVGIYGPNGAGKSTLLQALAG